MLQVVSVSVCQISFRLKTYTKIKFFARKLLRVFYTITNKDIEDEAAMIDRLLPHPYLVTVHNKGWLNNTSYYAIDMELCQYDLSVYIGVDGERLMRALQSDDLSDVLNQLLRILTIMGQITEGVAHIHSNNAVHRDIKPLNGMHSINFR